MLNRTTITVVFATTMLLLGMSVSSEAQSDKPVATIDYSGGSVAAGIGFSWGHGVLHFQGKDYRFTTNGLDIIDVGASSVEASGKVYNLKEIEDFPGNYVAATAGATVAGGAGAVAMQNQHGVVIEAVSTTAGLQLTLAPSGIAVALEGPPTN
jgi:hypothetical protein